MLWAGFNLAANGIKLRFLWTCSMSLGSIWTMDFFTVPWWITIKYNKERD